MSKTLTPSDWAEAQTLFERGEKSIQEIADMHGVTRQSIYQGFNRRGVKGQSRLSEVMEETTDAAKEARDARLKKANVKRDQYSAYNDALARIAMKKLLAADKSGNLSVVNADLIAIKNAGVIIERARKEGWDIERIDELLGDDDGLLPDLNVGEYDNEELEAIQKANEDEYLQSIISEDDDDDGEGEDE